MSTSRHIKINGSFRPLGGNATVPADAPIQPPQAWVDYAARFFAFMGGSPTESDFSPVGITELRLRDLWELYASNWEFAPSFLGALNLSSCALDSAALNEFLAQVAFSYNISSNSSVKELSLYGPEMGSLTADTPTGDAVAAGVGGGNDGVYLSVGGYGKSDIYSFPATNSALYWEDGGTPETSGWVIYGGGGNYIIKALGQDVSSPWYVTAWTAGTTGEPIAAEVTQSMANGNLLTLMAAGWHGDYKGPDGSQIVF